MPEHKLFSVLLHFVKVEGLVRERFQQEATDNAAYGSVRLSYQAECGSAGVIVTMLSVLIWCAGMLMFAIYH